MVTNRSQGTGLVADALPKRGIARGTRGLLGLSLVMILVLIGFGMQAAWPTSPGAEPPEAAPSTAHRVPVVLTPVREMNFEHAVVVSGNVQAKNYALVSARMPGSLDAMYVDRGDSVAAGETKLFQTDALKLTKAVAIAQQGLQVAEASVREKEASREQVVADRELAHIDLERYRNLVRDNAVPRQLFDQQETRAKQAAAMVKHAEALLALDHAKLEQARLSLVMAEKDLTDSQVVAPISGRVSERFKELGEMAAAGTPVLKIEDLSLLEVSVFLPEEHFALVVPEQTTMRIRVSRAELGVRTVAYKSPTVSPRLRTFEVKGLVDAPPPGVAPGCLAEVVIVLDARPGVGVPTAALQQRGGETIVYVVDSETARAVPVQTGRDSGGWTEILDGALPVGTAVISMGQQLVKDGAPVSVVPEAGR